MDARELYSRLELAFRPERCTEVFDKIGLQFDAAGEIGRVYTATFASQEVFAALEARDAHDCLLFTHHPRPQKEDLCGPYPPLPAGAEDLMRERRISLFSYHIPLDRNGPFSPGGCLARAMGMTPYGGFYFQNGVYMGVLCNSPYQTAEELTMALTQTVGHEVRLYRYGGETLSGCRVAIMAGGAKSTEIYRELAAKGVDIFITGVTNPAPDWVAAIHSAAKEAGVSLLGGTHYSTESFAPRAMTAFFERMGLPASFIPETPRLGDI